MRHFNEGRGAYASKEIQSDSAREKLQRCLDSHIVDVTPRWIGSDKLRSTYGGNSVAAVESSVNRCDPPLLVPKLVLEHGKSVVLVGPNGAGKSTILDAIMNRRGAGFDAGSHGYGKGIHGKETMRISRLNQEELLGDVNDLQAAEVLDIATKHFIEQFPVDWEDTEAYDSNMKNQEAEQRIQQLVSQVVQLFEAEQFLDRKVGELSGGERTKLSLLMVLASEPDVLLLDEPTNHLDLESIAKLTGLFETYKRAGASIVNVSHVDWFLDMAGEDGTIELTYTPTERKATQSTSPYRKFKKKERRKAAIKESIIWSKLPTKQAVGTLFTSPDKISVPNSPLKNVEAPLFVAGDIVVLSGKNGTGKTKLMLELANPHSAIMRREKGIQTALLPQLWPEEVMNGTVNDFFNWVKAHSNPHSEVSPTQLQKELQRLGLGDRRANPLQESFSRFSGGEQRLLWFACASIIEGADALILDEPSNHMDEPTMLKVVEAIRHFPGAIILSTHDLRLMDALQKDPGATRQGRGVTNIVFNRVGQQSTINKSSVPPLEFARQTIATARKAAGRVKV